MNDVAIWDNRSNWHTATYDYNDVRIGDRVVSLGEAPYFDPTSLSRKAALEKRELPVRVAAWTSNEREGLQRQKRLYAEAALNAE